MTDTKLRNINKTQKHMSTVLKTQCHDTFKTKKPPTEPGSVRGGHLLRPVGVRGGRQQKRSNSMWRINTESKKKGMKKDIIGSPQQLRSIEA